MSRALSTFTLSLCLIFSSQALAAEKKVIKSAMLYQERNQFDDENEFENYAATEQIIYDPYEKINRKIYIFNDAFDRHFFEHVARAYRYNIPRTLRKGVGNFLNNLSLPISALNSFAQGKVDNGLATFSNFLINSTIGLGGIFNVASEKGILYKNEDFGQTLGHYGRAPGAYLMIPFLGPNSTRDFSGWVVDKSINPVGFNLLEFGGDIDSIPGEYRFGLGVVGAIDSRENLLEIIDDVRIDSFDPYATIRSAYLQKRAVDAKN